PRGRPAHRGPSTTPSRRTPARATARAGDQRPDRPHRHLPCRHRLPLHRTARPPTRRDLAVTHDDHDQTLAAIEQRLLACDTPLDDIDARIAVVLGVPLDYYFAYRLLAGAIDSHRMMRTDHPPTR